ncbi:MAG TPA: hypothetical protein VGM56_23960 [Byssovorax sp.]|jgi:hypothetical protein
MKVKASDGKTYDVATAAPGKEHAVTLGGADVGAFVLEPNETRVTRAAGGSTKLLLDIAERFVDQGGAPMGML